MKTQSTENESGSIFLKTRFSFGPHWPILAVWATHHFPYQSEWQKRLIPGFYHALLHLTYLEKEKGQKKGLAELPVNGLSGRRGHKEMCLEPPHPAKPGQGWAGVPIPAGCKEKLGEDGPAPWKGWGSSGGPGEQAVLIAQSPTFSIDIAEFTVVEYRGIWFAGEHCRGTGSFPRWWCQGITSFVFSQVVLFIINFQVTQLYTW